MNCKLLVKTIFRRLFKEEDLKFYKNNTFFFKFIFRNRTYSVDTVSGFFRIQDGFFDNKSISPRNYSIKVFRNNILKSWLDL